MLHEGGQEQLTCNPDLSFTLCRAESADDTSSELQRIAALDNADQPARRRGALTRYLCLEGWSQARGKELCVESCIEFPACLRELV